jgi:hypothetical protein
MIAITSGENANARDRKFRKTIARNYRERPTVEAKFDTIGFRYASLTRCIIAPAEAKHNAIRRLKTGSPWRSYRKSGPRFRDYALTKSAGTRTVFYDEAHASFRR